MTKFSTPLSGILQHKNSEKEDIDRLLDVKYRNMIRKKAKVLEKQFIKKDDVPEKFAIQEDVAFMRRELTRSKTDVNITYPINPPYAFVNIRFNKKDGEYSYVIHEPKLKEDEEKILLTIKNKVESSMDKDEIPIEDGMIFGR